MERRRPECWTLWGCAPPAPQPPGPPSRTRRSRVAARAGSPHARPRSQPPPQPSPHCSSSAGPFWPCEPRPEHPSAPPSAPPSAARCARRTSNKRYTRRGYTFFYSGFVGYSALWTTKPKTVGPGVVSLRALGHCGAGGAAVGPKTHPRPNPVRRSSLFSFCAAAPPGARPGGERRVASESPGRAPGGSAELLWLGAGGSASKKKFTALC